MEETDYRDFCEVIVSRACFQNADNYRKFTISFGPFRRRNFFLDKDLLLLIRGWFFFASRKFFLEMELVFFIGASNEYIMFEIRRSLKYCQTVGEWLKKLFD